MKLFKGKPSTREPVRAGQVARVAAAFDARDDAVVLDVPGNTDYAKAQAVLDAVCRNSTDAEIRAARPGVTG